MKRRISFCFLIKTVLLVLSCSGAYGATFNVANGDVAVLKTAITTANGNGQDDTIELAANGSYTLIARDSFLNGLPAIGPDGGHKLTIHGNGSTIQRSAAAGTPTFRIFYINSGANATLSGLTITNGNPGAFHGGAIYNDAETGNATLTLINCVITGSSGDYGGAIFNDGASGGVGTASLTVINSTISGNTGTQYGGGIWNESGSIVMNVSNSTFSQNTAVSRDAGAIQFDGFGGSATGSITNCTFDQNSASQNGGGVYIDGESGSATLSISNCTFNGNSAGVSGRGIYNTTGASGGSAVLQIISTLFKSGGSGANIVNAGGTITSQGFNLSDDDAGGGAGTGPGGLLNHGGDQRNTDPLLDPLGLKANGGLTMTIALQATSPAIDQGKRSGTISGGGSIGSSTDQRGEFRPFDDPNITNASGGDGSDIGAYEADVRITAQSKVGVGGNDLQLNFTTILGHNYEIQHAPSPSGPWVQVSGTTPPPPVAGTGGIVIVTVTNAFSPSPQFYRVHQLP